MKFTGKKEYLLPVVFTFLGIVLTILLATKFIPDAVSYTLSVSEGSASEGEAEETDKNSAFYRSLYSISENGPFRILAEDENLFVFCDEKRLYRIGARFSDFPESDRSVISSGIDIADKAALFEIVGYLES